MIYDVSLFSERWIGGYTAGGRQDKTIIHNDIGSFWVGCSYGNNQKPFLFSIFLKLFGSSAKGMSRTILINLLIGQKLLFCTLHCCLGVIVASVVEKDIDS